MGTGLSRQESQRLQKEAKELIETVGKTQKDVAAQLNVSEKIIGVWIVKFKWCKKNEMTTKRKTAKRLVVVQGFSQKEAAKMVDVSEKTMSEWANKYQWKSNIKFITPTIEQEKYSLQKFARYVDLLEKRKDLCNAVIELIPGYLLSSASLTKILRADEEHQNL